MMPVELDVAKSLEAKEPAKAAEYYGKILESVKGIIYRLSCQGLCRAK